MTDLSARTNLCITVCPSNLLNFSLFRRKEKGSSPTGMSMVWVARITDNDLKNLSFLFVEESGGNVGLHASVD